MLNLENNSASLFILYLVISSNFLPQLFSCKLQKLLNSSMLVKHIAGFMTLIFFVVLTNTKDQISSTHILFISSIIYTWFIITTRTHLSIWFIIIFLLSIVYLLQLLENSLKESFQGSNDKDLETINSIKQFLTYTSLIISIAGFFIYMGEKKLEYGGEFSIFTFIMGKPQCRGYTPEYTIKNNISAIVK